MSNFSRTANITRLLACGEDERKRYPATSVSIGPTFMHRNLRDDPLAPDPPVISSALAWCGRIEAPWVRNLVPDPYIVMRMRECDTLVSYNNTLNKAFFLVPINPQKFEEIPTSLPFKKFRPIRGRLDKLTIKFENPDGTLYDFMGREHVLQFKLTCFKQNINYSSGAQL